MQKVGGGEDLYMRTYDTVDKAAMAALFFRDQHQRGLRDKAAKAASAGIRLKFLRALEASDFLDDPIVTAARGACGSSAGERRLRRNKGPSCSVKLPLCESMIATRRASSWTGMSWDYPDIDQRAVYLATVWAFDLGARVSQRLAGSPGRWGVAIKDLNTGLGVLNPSRARAPANPVSNDAAASASTGTRCHAGFSTGCRRRSARGSGS